MKIVVCTFGSRGDTQPYVALAMGLQQAGHCVTLVASAELADWIRSYGIDVFPLRFSLQEFMRTPVHQDAFRGHNPVRILRMFRSGFETYLTGVMQDCLHATREADFLLLSSIASLGVDIGRRRNIPRGVVSLQPLFPPTRAFPMFMLPLRLSLGGGYNYLTHTLYMRAGWLFVGGLLNRWRTTCLGLPPWRSMSDLVETLGADGTPWLYAYSPQVLPRPSDWDDHLHITGYWFLGPQPNWRPPVELVRFLAGGSPPIYIGFGSMVDREPDHLARLVLRALELSGQRGVLVTGGGAAVCPPTSASVLCLEDVPHSWLFPRVAAVVHHGGAGTTAAGLRAGVPSLIPPFQLDQYAWADRVARLGVGLRLSDRKGLTAGELAQAIHTAVTDSTLRARAAAFARAIEVEDGVARAVEIIERHARDFKRRRLMRS